MYKPQIVCKIVNPGGEDYEMEPEVILRLPFSRATLSFMVEALTAVVDGGTGTPAKIDDITIAGKTGTAQNPHGLEHSWFCCFAPVENPRIAIAVLVENAGHGSTHAAPIAREILKSYLLEKENI